jgi:hypothetical protein
VRNAEPLGYGDNNTTLDAGLYAKASIGERIWYDNNYNGIQDAGEPGVAGVAIELRNSSMGLVATTSTDANGNYLFTNLVPGNYVVDVTESTLPANYSFTSPNVGNDSQDSDVDGKGGTYPISSGVMAITTLSPGEDDRARCRRARYCQRPAHAG